MTGRPDDVGALLFLFGDQLNIDSAALKSLDRDRDVVMLAEVAEEATHVPSHKARTALFLSAMRHFARALESEGYRVRYVRLDDDDNTHSFSGEAERAVKALRPERLVCMRPGEWRVLQMIDAWGDQFDIGVEMVEDDHFYVEPAEFEEWLAGRKVVLLEHFYRKMRKRFEVLLTEDGEPVGGAWNFDKDNRQSLDDDARPIPEPISFTPDDVTQDVFKVVEARFPDAPGSLDGFDWPVTRAQARRALTDFIKKRLPEFGAYQDAMAMGERWLFHSRLSAALNLHLLDPRECVAAAVDAYEAGGAPINSVEGFVRQLLGWREFIRGVYWAHGPAYAKRNGLRQYGDLPKLYWTGDTDMRCMAESVDQVLSRGYGHHIQRLMVTGAFALMAGVHPRHVSDWYLGMYVDAVDWVTLPNTLGMAMHADGGVVGTKPYAASGKYIQRMSDYCDGCRYDPATRTGEGACPFTTLYWDFLIRHRESMRGNNRMAMILKNVDRLPKEQRAEITVEAKRLRRRLGVGRISSG